MDFTQIMKEHSTEKLKEIVTTKRDEYNPEALSAAENELKHRDVDLSEDVKKIKDNEITRKEKKYKKSVEGINQNMKSARLAILLIWIVLGIEIISLISNILEYNLLMSVNRGFPITFDEANSNDTRQQVIAIISLIVYLASAFTFLVWFSTAYSNLHKLVKDLRFAKGWAFGSWLIPIMNLSRPYAIMKELYEETKEFMKAKGVSSDYQLTSGILGAWWALWLISNLLAYFISRYSFSTEEIDEMAGWTLFSMIANVLLIISAIVTVKVIKDYSRAELVLKDHES